VRGITLFRVWRRSSSISSTLRALNRWSIINARAWDIFQSPVDKCFQNGTQFLTPFDVDLVAVMDFDVSLGACCEPRNVELKRFA
jgi:hypothetical protein